MDNPRITIKRTKEELRRYNIFSAIERRPLRRILQYLGPLLGLVQVGIYIFWVPNTLNLVIGAFLALYPFVIRYSVIRASDKNFDRNNLQDYEVYVTFNEDNFISETDVVCQKIMYSEIFKVYNRKEDIILFLNRYSGLYISKSAYDEHIVTRIIELIQQSIPEKF
ncbi:hypothetical protein KQ51_00252 [Candidatus Izimaplasma bacterium HR1]|jgi:hypothetical protein|uniref:YcxB family protein n=1 Tax=Candidatus Izimoplasma sp. HR1 TaxID=1541959 RepID=UPI0004F59039|nr:hypothetical protein KQ51_00252 [Candidatus Izimaplasma bacterium HR1]